MNKRKKSEIIESSLGLAEKLIPQDQVMHALQSLRNEEGMLTPTMVLEAAKSKEHILHEYFEWDDSVAAEKYRLIQAGKLIVSVRVQYNSNPSPAFIAARVVVNNKSRRGYFNVEQIVTEEDLMKSVTNELLREIKHLKEKYKEILSLHAIFNDEAIRELENDSL